MRLLLLAVLWAGFHGVAPVNRRANGAPGGDIPCDARLREGRLRAAPEGLKVTTDRTVDTSSLESIVRDVVRLADAATNDEKAIALHTWLHHTIFHAPYPVETPPQSVGPLKVIKVYGWGLCGGQHTVLKALFETAGWKVRYRGWSNPGHTTIEVFYDGRWHYFDVFLKCYYWTRDRKTIAGQDDIKEDPGIVREAPQEGRVPPDHYLCCGDDPEGVVQGCKTSTPYPPSRPEDGWASVTGRDRNYAPSLRLPAGATMRLEWRGEPGQAAVPQRSQHSCGIRDFRNDRTLGPILEHYGPRNHSNGRLIYAPDFSRAADMADIALENAQAKAGKIVAPTAGSAVFKLPLPYPYVTGRLEAELEGHGTFSISTDGGQSWSETPGGDISARIRQKYDVWIKAEFSGALSKLRFEAVVQHNRSAQPYLLAGSNVVTLSAAEELPPDRTVRVTYAFQEATAAEKRTQFDGSGLSYGEPRTVSETARSLPHRWRIDVGGNTPPKMLYLEYAVQAR
ncbi:MAG TPA: hypothetical protein VNO22_10255 [Planctomycetota bacterium]|nr:hypothetical protein [Planctomycetota bacterium]